MSKSEWYEHKACRDYPLEYFFDESGVLDGQVSSGTAARRYLAKQVCAVCPVAQECSRLAGRNDFGVFGGIDQWERARLADRTPAKREVALAAVAYRLRWDGLSWREVAARLDVPEAQVRQVCSRKKNSRRVRETLRDYSAWADIARGWPPEAIRHRYGYSSHVAEKMCLAMDKHPQYQGPRGKFRHATDITETAAAAYAQAG